MWWYASVVSATWEAEVGGSLEPRRWRLQWDEVVPLHSSLVTEWDPHLKKKVHWFKDELDIKKINKDHINVLFYFSKLQKTKRDIRWLQGVTGEWFEEIQRKKFCNETDVSQMLKQPLTYRLRKEMAKNGKKKILDLKLISLFLWHSIVDNGPVDLQCNQSMFRTILKL